MVLAEPTVIGRAALVERVISCLVWSYLGPRKLKPSVIFTIMIEAFSDDHEPSARILRMIREVRRYSR